MDVTLTKAGISVLLANGKNLLHAETKNKLRSLLDDTPDFAESKQEVVEIKAPPKPWTSPAVPGLIQPIWKMLVNYEDLKRRVQNLEKIFCCFCFC
jgi:DNA-directed RNA polymerase